MHKILLVICFSLFSIVLVCGSGMAQDPIKWSAPLNNYPEQWSPTPAPPQYNQYGYGYSYPYAAYGYGGYGQNQGYSYGYSAPPARQYGGQYSGNPIITEDSWINSSRLQGGAQQSIWVLDSGNNLIRFDQPVFLRLAVSYISLSQGLLSDCHSKRYAKQVSILEFDSGRSSLSSSVLIPAFHNSSYTFWQCHLLHLTWRLPV